MGNKPNLKKQVKKITSTCINNGNKISKELIKEATYFKVPKNNKDKRPIFLITMIFYAGPREIKDCIVFEIRAEDSTDAMNLAYHVAHEYIVDSRQVFTFTIHGKNLLNLEKDSEFSIANIEMINEDEMAIQEEIFDCSFDYLWNSIDFPDRLIMISALTLPPITMLGSEVKDAF